MGRKFEIFSGGCELCKKAIETLKDAVSEKHEIVEYSLQSPIKEEIQKKIEKYDINAVPSIIVDEEHKYIGILNPDEIKKIIEDD
ncbi:MAG: thioredoxin family protein [Promethearchaeota archaeon]|jgi:protein-disulfide isomerase